MRLTRRIGIGCAVVMAEAFVARAASANPPPARDVIAVVVGANVGGNGEEPLRYAVSDARRVRDLLSELGDVRPGNAVFVTAEAPAEVLDALRVAKQRAAALGGSGRPVMLVFYFSGHGDEGAIHLAKGTLALSDLRAAVADVPADLRLSILDACRTSGQSKGVTAGSEFELRLAPAAPHGSVELRASALGEAAQESDELGGAVFTHFVVSGLRGGADTDGDGRVTLPELYAYAYRKTLLRSTSGAVVQHPAVQMELAGSGDVVLTMLDAAPAFIEVPRGPQRYLVFTRAAGTAVGEVSGEGTSRLAVPAAKLIVVRRTASTTSAASVDLSGGGTKRLADADFRPIAREALTRRGETLDLRPRRVEARSGLELATAGSDRFAVRVGGAFVYEAGAVEVGIDVAYVGGPFDSAAFDGAVHSVTGGPSVGWRIERGRFTFVGSLGAELRYSWQHLVRAERARVAAAGFTTDETRSFASVGPRATLAATVALGGDWSASVLGSFSALVRRETGAGATDHLAVHPLVGLTFALGYSF